MKNKNIHIIGAGLSGLSAAYFLSQNNIPCEIFEKEATLGGLCRTVSMNGFNFDYTGHLLHTSSDETRAFLSTMLGRNIYKHQRNSWIFSSGVYTPYPFQSHTFGLPTAIRKKCLFGYIDAYAKYIQNDRQKMTDFKAWVYTHFGKGIAHYFMFPYNEKLWSMNIAKLTTSWMKGYVPKPNLLDVIQGTFTDAAERVGYNASFVYPTYGGIQSLINGIHHHLSVPIQCNSRVEKISMKKKYILVNGVQQPYHILVSSAPLRTLVLDMIDDAPHHIRNAAKQLSYNRVLNINLGINRIISDKHWIYFPEKKYCFYRVGFNSNFGQGNAPKNATALYTEISLDHDITQKDISYFSHRIVKDLVKADILSKHDIVKAMCCLHLDPAYVMYDTYRDECVEEILAFLKKNHILSIGRYGKWEYSAMEDAILGGKNTAAYIASL